MQPYCMFSHGSAHFTIKVPSKIAADDTLIFLFLLFEENKASHDSQEKSSLSFSEKQGKGIYECHLLQS